MEDGKALVVTNRLQVPEAYAARLEQGFAHSTRMEGVPGCLGFEFLRREEGGEYLVVTRWTDRAAYDAWRESDAFQRAHAHTNPDSPVQSELAIYEVLLHQP